MPVLGMPEYLRRVNAIYSERIDEQDEHIRRLEKKIRHQKDSLRRLHIAMRATTRAKAEDFLELHGKKGGV